MTYEKTAHDFIIFLKLSHFMDFKDMIVITLGKNALPLSINQEKHLEDFTEKFKAEFGYLLTYQYDQNLDRFKVSFRFERNDGVPLQIADKILKRIESAFNVL